MTLDQIRYFTAVATYQHVGRAALSVAISPSVISATIASLAEELQCELFRKSGRRIELTSEGKALHERFKLILTEIDGIKAQMRNDPEILAGRFRLGGSPFLSSRLLLTAWNKLQLKNPQLIADFYSMNTAHAVAEIVSGRIDLALCFSPQTHPDLKELRISEGELQVVVRKNHPILKKSKKDQLRFLAEGKAVVHKSSQGVESCESHPIFEKMGFQPKIELYFDSDDVAIQKVIQSDSWSFVPDVVVEAYDRQLEVVSLPKEFGKASYHISALIRRERSNEKVLQELIGLFKKN